MTIGNPTNIQPTVPQNPKKQNLRIAAEQWITENQVAYKKIMDAAKALAASKKHFGIGLLVEQVRRNNAVQTSTAGVDFKINNNYRAYIARKLVDDEPSLEPWLTFRETKY